MYIWFYLLIGGYITKNIFYFCPELNLEQMDREYISEDGHYFSHEEFSSYARWKIQDLKDQYWHSNTIRQALLLKGWQSLRV